MPLSLPRARGRRSGGRDSPPQSASISACVEVLLETRRCHRCRRRPVLVRAIRRRRDEVCGRRSLDAVDADLRGRRATSDDPLRPHTRALGARPGRRDKGAVGFGVGGRPRSPRQWIAGRAGRCRQGRPRLLVGDVDPVSSRDGRRDWRVVTMRQGQEDAVLVRAPARPVETLSRGRGNPRRRDSLRSACQRTGRPIFFFPRRPQHQRPFGIGHRPSCRRPPAGHSGEITPQPGPVGS